MCKILIYSCHEGFRIHTSTNSRIKIQNDAFICASLKGCEREWHIALPIGKVIDIFPGDFTTMTYYFIQVLGVRSGSEYLLFSKDRHILMWDSVKRIVPFCRVSGDQALNALSFEQVVIPHKTNLQAPYNIHTSSTPRVETPRKMNIPGTRLSQWSIQVSASKLPYSQTLFLDMLKADLEYFLRGGQSWACANSCFHLLFAHGVSYGFCLC